MVDEELKKSVIQDVTLLKLVGFKPIIVHGGGKEISKWVGKVGMEPGIYQRTQKDRCGNDGNCRDGIVQGQQIPSTDGRGTWCQCNRYQRKRWWTAQG